MNARRAARQALRDRKRFRIKWANLITMLGASALFVWVLLILMEGKFG